MKTWQEIMFNKDELVCTSDSVQEVKARPIKILYTKPGQYVCLNPLNGPRKDANVASHRNILFEFDEGSIDEQKDEIHKSCLPYSILTFSGNKSLHAVVCLEEPLPAADYKKIVKQAYKKFKNIDQSCSNPSRFTRTPSVINLKTGEYQQQLTLPPRKISNHLFFEWLGPIEVETLPKSLKMEPTSEGYVPLLNIFTKHYLAFGSEPGKRNSDLFKAACDMFKCGWTESEIFATVVNIADLDNSEIKHTIESAKRTARK